MTKKESQIPSLSSQARLLERDIFKILIKYKTKNKLKFPWLDITSKAETTRKRIWKDTQEMLPDAKDLHIKYSKETLEELHSWLVQTYETSTIWMEFRRNQSLFLIITFPIIGIITLNLFLGKIPDFVTSYQIQIAIALSVILFISLQSIRNAFIDEYAFVISELLLKRMLGYEELEELDLDRIFGRDSF